MEFSLQSAALAFYFLGWLYFCYYRGNNSKSQTPANTSANMSAGKVIEIDSEAVFKALTSSGPAIVDFYATWCGPCKAIAPKFVQWSEQNPNVRFLKVDVDKMQQIASTYGVRAMPTFIAFRNGRVLQEIRGANVPELQRIIQQLAA